MKKQSIKLQNGNCFSYDDVKSDWVQNLLKESYVHSDKSRAYCCCQGDDESLELVIAYRRKTELFELRKMPGQSSSLHAETCLFSRSLSQSSLSSISKNFYITMPSKENASFADHGALEVLHKRLLKVIRDDVKYHNWYLVKSGLLEDSKSLMVNNEPLSKILNILTPTTKEKARPIWFKGEEPRLLFGEFLSLRKIEGRCNVAFHIKGSNETVWFNNPAFSEVDLKLLTSVPDENKRLLVLCSIKKSSSGSSVQGYGLSAKIINKKFNQRDLE